MVMHWLKKHSLWCSWQYTSHTLYMLIYELSQLTDLSIALWIEYIIIRVRIALFGIRS